MDVVGVIVLYGMLAFFDLIPLLNEKRIKEIGIYSVFILASLVFSILLIFEIPALSLSQIIENIIKQFVDL